MGFFCGKQGSAVQQTAESMCSSVCSKSQLKVHDQGFTVREAAVLQLKNLENFTLSFDTIQHFGDAGQITKKKHIIDCHRVVHSLLPGWPNLRTRDINL